MFGCLLWVLMIKYGVDNVKICNFFIFSVFTEMSSKIQQYICIKKYRKKIFFSAVFGGCGFWIN